MLLDSCKLHAEKRFRFASDPDFPCLGQTHRTTESGRVFDVDAVRSLHTELFPVCDSMLVDVSTKSCSTSGAASEHVADSFVFESSSSRTATARQVTENFCRPRA